MRALVLAAALLVSACAYGPTVRTDFDPSANFQAYRTYSWVDTAVPQGMNPLMFARVRSSIDQALAARGYSNVSAGDFSIAFTIGDRDRIRVYEDPFYPGWGWGGWGHPYSYVDVDQYVERSVVIDIYDGRSRRPVWHGVGTHREYSDDVNYAKLDQAIVAALAKFPPQPAVAEAR